MSAAMPAGQFVPGDSPLHRLDARVKIAVAAVYAFSLFAVDTFWGLAAAALACACGVMLARVPWRMALRGLKPVLWLVAFTVLMNALDLDAVHPLVRIGRVGIAEEGLRRGLFFAARILLLVVGTALVTLTTSPVALTDALALIMRPLRVLRVPVDDFAMMLSIALRFMPTTAEEAERIVVAQTARGARFDQGGPVRRARAWIPVLIPLFVNLFRRADTLAVAMEARCYRGEGRTRLRKPVMRNADWAWLAMSVLAGVAIGVLL